MEKEIKERIEALKSRMSDPYRYDRTENNRIDQASIERLEQLLEDLYGY